MTTPEAQALVALASRYREHEARGRQEPLARLGSDGMIADGIQRAIDAFYWERGPCCAGCDWWRHFNSQVGECLKSAPVSGEDRWAMIGYSSPSIVGAGHVATTRDHHCGDFKDEFDWSSLTLAYRKDVGAPTFPPPTRERKA